MNSVIWIIVGVVVLLAAAKLLWWMFKKAVWGAIATLIGMIGTAAMIYYKFLHGKVDLPFLK